jgi:hypothetical protein
MLFSLCREAHLAPHHLQPIGSIAGQNFGIDGKGRFELRQLC